MKIKPQITEQNNTSKILLISKNLEQITKSLNKLTPTKYNV